MHIPDDRDALLTRKQGAAALTAAGYQTSAGTLSTKATRGGGPPFRHFGPRVLYRWGDLLDWAEGRLGPTVRTTAELDVLNGRPPALRSRKRPAARGTEAARRNTAESDAPPAFVAAPTD